MRCGGMIRCPLRGQAKGLARPTALLLFAALASGLTAYSAAMWSLYSPMYTSVHCRRTLSLWGPLDINGTRVTTTASFERSCQNPNSYWVQVVQQGPGRVFLKEGSMLVPIGNTTLTDVSLPPNGEGRSDIHLEVMLPNETLFEERPVQIAIEFVLRSEAKLEFLGFPATVVEDLDETCGFEMMLATGQTGPMACAPASEEFFVPRIDEEADPQRALRISEEHMSAVAERKNVFFGFFVVFWACVAVASLLAGMRGCREWHSPTNPKMVLP
mmetsp:Transcript_151609/g.486492  ORF Transcript_151609/g.486492 Transcript_151609/m.486492 type:complete len:271 (+) Transcript_151609:127-939(+)